MNSAVRIEELECPTDGLLDSLAELWQASVRQSHLFLSEQDIADIAPHVKPAIKGVPSLCVARAEDGAVCGFMGIDGPRLEMLFIHPRHMGQGLGSKLVSYGVARFGIGEVCVNEQNPGAVAFYRRMGFEVERRTDTDEQGRPFPLLYMVLR